MIPIPENLKHCGFCANIRTAKCMNCFEHNNFVLKNEISAPHELGNNANLRLCVRSFSFLDKEIEHDGRKFIPIKELARLSGFSLVDFPILSSGAGSGCEKGNYRVSNIPLNTETQFDKYHAFVFSIDNMSFYYYHPNGKRVIEKQFTLYQKLREWGFIE